LTGSLYHSIHCRDRAWSAGAGLYLSVPAGEAVLWLPRRSPDENAKAGHPAAHRLQHDNRYLSLSLSLSPSSAHHSIYIYDSDVVNVALSYQYFTFYNRAVTHHLHGCVRMIRKIAVH